ncbi:MAG: beta-N-acetylhexosaminidase, partial [Candidatus Sulfotelmatobacter sp.]
MKKRRFFSPFALLLLVPATFAETPAPTNQLKLLPEPKEVHLQQGGFEVRPTTKILVEFGHQAEDRIAAETLAEEIHDESGLELSITGTKADSKQTEAKRERGDIVLARLQDPNVRQFLESKGLKADSIGDQGYLLFADKSQVIVAANTGQGLFYGVQTLRQLLRADGKHLVCPAVSIRDWPSMQWRGVQDDISRGPIPTQEFMERQIRTLAAFKVNLFALYMEHVFDFPSQPLIAPK